MALIVSKPIKPLLSSKLEKAIASQIVYCDIITSKKGRIVRPPKDEPWEAELMLVKSTYGADSALDLTGKDEPGQVKYYLVEMPLHAELRTKRRTAISTHWLNSGKCFDSLEEAKKAYYDNC